MSIGIIAEVILTEEGAESMIQTMKERLPSVTRKQDGCEYVHLYSDPSNPNHLILLERWASREQYDKYRAWAMTQPGTEEILQHVVREFEWRYLDDTGA